MGSDPNIEVIFPFHGECEYRLHALAWVTRRCSFSFQIAPGVDPWRKAAAVMPAVEQSSADVIVMHDADVWTSGLHEAIAAVQAGAAWAIPHRTVKRLSEQITRCVWDAERIPEQPELAQSPYEGITGGGIVVSTRDNLLAVPLDPRFIGWGQEDETWGIALTTMLGDPWRGNADLFHLWHPPQQRLTRTRGSRESWSLRCRYYHARRDKDQMQALLTEARNAR